MIDIHDIAILQRWLKLAATQGTDVLKIVVADQPNTWTVWCDQTKGEKR